jgi:hypothetical protein
MFWIRKENYSNLLDVKKALHEHEVFPYYFTQWFFSSKEQIALSIVILTNNFAFIFGA